MPNLPTNFPDPGFFRLPSAQSYGINPWAAPATPFSSGFAAPTQPPLGSILSQYSTSAPVLPQSNIGMNALGGLGVQNPTGLGTSIPAYQARLGVPTGLPGNLSLPPGTTQNSAAAYGNLYGGKRSGPRPKATPRPAPTPAAGSTAPAGSGTTNPYSAFWGRNPLNIRTGLSPTGAVGSKLPGVLTANRGFGPSPTGAVGSRLPGAFTNQLTGARNVGAGLGTALALQALPGLTAQGYTALTGNAPSQQGMETAQSSAGAAGLGLMFGAPVAAAAGLGTFVGDAVGSSGGLGVANTLRGWMGMDPTDDTIGDILGRAPIVGGWFGGGAADGEQAADPVAALPPTPDSIATVGQMAGLDASSTGFLQQQFANSVALSTAQYMADPETFQAQFEAQYGRPMESEADIAQVVFGRIVSEGLPAALENQSAQAAALQNAAMYQDFISQYMAPIRDQYNDLGAQAAAAGYGDLALQFQGQGASQESAMRAIPNLEALKAQQAQVNQLAQQQWQASMSGTGSTGSDPLGDAATLDALMAAAG